MTDLARIGQGFVLFDLPPPTADSFIQPGSITFAAHSSGYSLVGIGLDTVSLRAFDTSAKERAIVEDIHQRWVRCSERLDVEYAYLGGIGVEQELEYAQEELDKLLRHDVRALLDGYQSYWLIYFGAPYLALPAMALKLEEPEMTRQELPSGAAIIRSGEFPLP